MKLKKLFALILVFAFIMTLVPVATFADDLPGESPVVTAPTVTPESEKDKIPGAETPTETKPGGETPTETKPGGETPTETKPGTETPTETKPGTETPMETKPGTETPTEIKPEVPPVEPGLPPVLPIPPVIPIPIVLPVPVVPEDAKALVQRLEEADTLFDFWTALQELTEEQWVLLQQSLPEEMYNQYQELAKMEQPAQEEPMTVAEESAEDSPVPFTDVAPLMPPVSGPEMMKTKMTEELATPSPLMMRSMMGPAGARGFAAAPMGLEDFAAAPMGLEDFVSVAAEGTTASEATKDIKGLELGKVANGPDKNGNYNITLDAYVTGEFQKTTVSRKIPADIVLVLDESGSMAEKFASTSSSQYSYLGGTFERAYNNRENLYWKNGDGSFVKVIMTKTYVGSDSWDYIYKYTFTKQGEKTPIYSEVHYASDRIFWVDKLYKKLCIKGTVNTDISRIDALKKAANDFVASVQADNGNLKLADGEVGHRIAVVGFATDSRNITNKLNPSNSTQGLLLSDDSSISTAISKLTADGATNTQAGMAEAASIIQNNPIPADTQRNQVVILFTDGVPTVHTQFNKDVANGAITAAKQIKDAGATVYTIGVFPGADANKLEEYPDASCWNDYGRFEKDNSLAPSNRFMHYVSSNAPEASDLSDEGVKTKDGYYLVASKSEELQEIFDAISEQVETGGASAKGLDNTTVLKDVISPYFQIVDKNAIKVYTAKCTSVSNNAYVFGPEEEYTNAVVHVSQDGKTVEVSGFDYSNNYVALKTDGKTCVGQKLMVQIPVKPIDGFFGGNGVPTNEKTSGVYKDGTSLEPFEEPSVNVPLNYQCKTKPQSIYLSNSANVKDMIDWDNSLKPDGIKNAFVDLTFTVKQVNKQDDVGIIGIITAKTPNINSLSGTVTPSDCTDYTISCTLTPKVVVNSNQPKSFEPSGGAATVHVLKPTINTQDAWSDYKQTVNLENCLVFGDGNQNVTWSDFVAEHTNHPEPTGDKPTIQASGFRFAHMEDNSPVGDTNTFQPTTEANFQISRISLGNGATTYTNDAGHKYFAFGRNSNEGTNGKLPGSHITIHLNRFDFVLIKNVEGNRVDYPQSFIFDVTYGEDTYPIAMGSTGGEKTIKGIPYGKGTELKVLEQKEWSWRYQGSGSNTVTIPSHDVLYGTAPTLQAPYSISLTNKLSKQKWLGGTDFKANHYASNVDH